MFYCSMYFWNFYHKTACIYILRSFYTVPYLLSWYISMKCSTMKWFHRAMISICSQINAAARLTQPFHSQFRKEPQNTRKTKRDQFHRHSHSDVPKRDRSRDQRQRHHPEAVARDKQPADHDLATSQHVGPQLTGQRRQPVSRSQLQQLEHKLPELSGAGSVLEPEGPLCHARPEHPDTLVWIHPRAGSIF